jgi:hypothetical protein
MTISLLQDVPDEVSVLGLLCQPTVNLFFALGEMASTTSTPNFGNTADKPVLKW